MKDAGLLLARVNTVEDKAGTRFAGIDARLGILNLAACRRTPWIVAPLRRVAGAALERVTIAGKINEAIDLLAEDVTLPTTASICSRSSLSFLAVQAKVFERVFHET